MKTREVYDLFAADVATRREKVAASEAKKAASKEAKKVCGLSTVRLKLH